MFFVHRWTGVSPFGVSGIVFSSDCSGQCPNPTRLQIHTHQLVKHTLVQPPLLRPAVPELLVVVLKALPVAAKLVKALLVDVADAAKCQRFFQTSKCRSSLHTRRTPGDLAALLHALQLSPAVGLGLAHHVVIVVGLASRADKERGAEEGRRTGSEFLDLWDIVGQRGGVDEGLLVEAGQCQYQNCAIDSREEIYRG